MSNYSKLRAGWLGDLPREFADAFLKTGRWMQINSGQIIYGIGANDNNLYGIASGTARMQMAMNEHEQRLSHVIGPGFWFGENEFVSGSLRMLEFEAATDMLLLKINRNDFLQLSREFPAAWKWIALLAGQHLITAMGAVDDLMLSAPQKRMASILLRLSGNRLGHPRTPPIKAIPATQQELATAANLSRASAGSILREMEKNGEISIGYGALVICNADALIARVL